MKKYFCNRSQKKIARDGFTLIELSLSIAFIAILSIAVTLIITNSIASYRRGLTLNSINTTGMDLVDDMRAAVQNAPARPPVSYCSTIYRDSEDNNFYEQCTEDQGGNFVSVTRKGNVKIGSSTVNVPLFGAFCSGTYSYIWNSGYFFTDDSESKVEDEGLAKASLQYRFLGDSGVSEKNATDFKLLKVRDKNRDVCVSALNTSSSGADDKRYVVSSDKPINGGGSVFDIRREDYAILAEEPIDILSGDINNNLSIYDLTSMAPASSVSMNNAFYATSFILGTIQGGINIDASGNFCATPEGYESTIENFDYCAINKFNFAAQANGG